MLLQNFRFVVFAIDFYFSIDKASGRHPFLELMAPQTMTADAFFFYQGMISFSRGTSRSDTDTLHVEHAASHQKICRLLHAILVRFLNVQGTLSLFYF
jgi:hypothetical protein